MVERDLHQGDRPGTVKLLWVKTDFLHPTNRGGQIRTLETLRRLHARHEVHYICFDDPEQQEGPSRAHEYAKVWHTVPHQVARKSLTSPVFLAQLAKGLFSDTPVPVERWTSLPMKKKIEELKSREKYDTVVCDFLFPAPNVPELSDVVLFQHNVEAMIWKRHAQHATGLKKMFFELQAKRMTAFEAKVCREVKRVIAVSDGDARIMREQYGVRDCEAVPTGVDTDYFRPNGVEAGRADLVFVGSMDWMPNQEGMRWFHQEIWPLILAKRPQTTLAIVGRQPTEDIRAMADDRIQVTGTVPDVRPWLWGSQVSIVPLRIGGGTRLKIYEAMAAQVPVVSTTIGAEGLEVDDGGNIVIADNPGIFADRCVDLLNSPGDRQRIANRAAQMVADRYSWESVTTQFERLLR